MNVSWNKSSVHTHACTQGHTHKHTHSNGSVDAIQDTGLPMESYLGIYFLKDTVTCGAFLTVCTVGHRV